MISHVALVVTICAGLGAFAAPAPDAASRFKVFQMPTANSGPCDLTPGPDGNIWVEDQLVNKIVRINTKTYKITEFDIPYTSPVLNVTLPSAGGRTSFACAIQPGADGNIYASNGVRNQLVKIDLKTEKVSVITPQPFDPAGNLQPFNDLFTGPNGMYFTQTTSNRISYLDYKTGKMQNWQLSNPAAGPLGIYYASDGGVWFCEFTGQAIGRLDPKTGKIKEWPVPASLLAPAVMRAETQGRYLWFTAALGNAVGRIDMQTGAMKAYPNDRPASVPGVDIKDGQGNIWFSTFNINELNKLNPSTGQVTHITMPGTLVPVPVSIPYYLDISVTYNGHGENAIWYTNDAANQVGRYQL